MVNDLAPVTTEQLNQLPKAHLHLHFTGSLTVAKLQEMALARNVRLPRVLMRHDPMRLSPDRRGWFRFQRLYDSARTVVQGEDALRAVVANAATLDRAEGVRWLELQVDPTGYAGKMGGITPALEVVLDEARNQSDDTFGVAIIVAASRMKHPLDARTLARLAARHAGNGPGSVVGFGLSNDERSGDTSSFARAFEIARNAGLASFPHGGELLGPEHIRTTLGALNPTRLGHGVRATEDPQLLDALVSRGVGLEVCPSSNASLGVYPTAEDVPLRTLVRAGAKVALGADDPLIFGPRITEQYAIAHRMGFTTSELAQLARDSFTISTAPRHVVTRAHADIDAWEARVAKHHP